MTRRRLLALSSVLLILAVAVAAATGQIALAFDLNRFALHRYVAYAVLALAVLHLGLAAPTLFTAFSWRGAIGRRAGRSAPASGEPGGRVARRFALGLGVGLVAGAGAGTAFGRWQRGLDVPPELDEAGDLGVLYHRWSQPSYVGGLVKSFAPIGQPPLYKEDPGAPQVALPSPSEAAGLSVGQAIQRRRSRRGYLDRPMTLQQFSDLLYLAVGETDRRDPSWPFRAFPSAGALYPTETYVGVRAVEGLEQGIYHYQPKRHAVARIREGDFSGALMRAAMDQEMVGEAGAVIVLTTFFDRLRWKYRDRSYRYALLEAGHIGQNTYLAAEALGLGCCAVGAFFDDQLNELLGVDGTNEATVFMLVVGRSSDAR